MPESRAIGLPPGATTEGRAVALPPDAVAAFFPEPPARWAITVNRTSCIWEEALDGQPTKLGVIDTFDLGSSNPGQKKAHDIVNRSYLQGHYGGGKYTVSAVSRKGRRSTKKYTIFGQPKNPPWEGGELHPSQQPDYFVSPETGIGYGIGYPNYVPAMPNRGPNLSVPPIHEDPFTYVARPEINPIERNCKTGFSVQITYEADFILDELRESSASGQHYLIQIEDCSTGLKLWNRPVSQRVAVGSLSMPRLFRRNTTIRVTIENTGGEPIYALEVALVGRKVYDRSRLNLNQPVELPDERLTCVPEQDGITVSVSREYDPQFPASIGGVPIQFGHLFSVSFEAMKHDPEGYIRNLAGGGAFRCQARDDKGRFLSSKRIKIAGEPRNPVGMFEGPIEELHERERFLQQEREEAEEKIAAALAGEEKAKEEAAETGRRAGQMIEGVIGEAQRRIRNRGIFAAITGAVSVGAAWLAWVWWGLL